ncbi:MAG TPA: DNA-binding response regulator [Clostridiales bacterium]|nr:DNA-binding response regulator [Clostridiales bacterium]
MARLLIVDDEAKIREVLRLYAEFEGHDCVEAEDGMQAVKLARDNNFDVIIMDVMMPKLDGYYAVKEIRKFSQVPVIMLSARTEEYDRLFGFEVGVDDYVVKPFSPKEVMARVAALLKRVNPGKGATIVSEGLEIDIPGRNVYVDGKKVNMTPKEYELLFYLAQNRGIAISREQLLSNVWGYDFYGDDRTVDTHIKMLRSSLGRYREKIVTLRGLGYKMEL